MLSYACTDCYILAHDSTYEHPLNAGLDSPSLVVDPYDIDLTDWAICPDCADTDSSDTCVECDGTGGDSGLTVGGTCDLGQHEMTGYWEYHAFIA